MSSDDKYKKVIQEQMAKLTKHVNLKVFTSLKTNADGSKVHECVDCGYTMGLLKIYEFQTYTEQEYGTTHDANNVGFTGADAEFLTSIAKGLIKYKRLSCKQMVFLFKKMPKYWKQIISISDSKQLEKMVRQARVRV